MISFVLEHFEKPDIVAQQESMFFFSFLGEMGKSKQPPVIVTYNQRVVNHSQNRKTHSSIAQPLATNQSRVVKNFSVKKKKQVCNVDKYLKNCTLHRLLCSFTELWLGLGSLEMKMYIEELVMPGTLYLKSIPCLLLHHTG